MRPYYEQDGITIYCGDAREVLPQIAAESVDLVLTDPPYAVRDDAWDTFEDAHAFEFFTGRWLGQASRIARTVACFFPDKYLPLLMRAAQHRGVTYRRSLIWRKPPGSQFAGATLDGMWFDFEGIYVFGDAPTQKQRNPLFSVLEWHTVTGQQHGCEKPIGLLRQIIDRYCSPSGTILDPFMGSGTTLRAAKDLGRRAIGIELEERYCEIAVRRLQQSVLPLDAA